MVMSFRATALCLGLVLAGCAVNIPTSPDTFSIAPDKVPPWPKTQAVALANGHAAEAKLQVAMAGGVSWVFDQKQMTETAIGMLRRAMAENGVRSDSDAGKRITLRVRVVRAGLRRISVVTTTTGRVALEAQFGDGTGTYVEGDNADNSMLNQFGKAFDGAILDALNHLLADEKFSAYMQR